MTIFATISPELSDKLYEIAAQTVADVLLIGIAGLTANFILERYKAHQALRVEVAKRRVDKMDEIWILFGELETTVKDTFEEIDKYKESPNDTSLEQITKFGAMLKPHLERYESINKQIQISLLKNRFWIGNSFYKKFIEYQAAIEQYAQCLMEGDKETTLAQYNVLQSKKLTVLDFLRNPDE